MLKDEIDSVIRALELEHLSKNAIRHLEKHLKEVLELQREHLAKKIDNPSPWQVGPMGYMPKEDNYNFSRSLHSALKPKAFFEGRLE